MLLFIKRKVPDVSFITAKNRASKGNGSWKNYCKEKNGHYFWRGVYDHLKYNVTVLPLLFHFEVKCSFFSHFCFQLVVG